MSWLQVYTLRLRSHERSVGNGRVLFAIEFAMGQQDDSRAREMAKRSYSEFRTLWKALQRATKASAEEMDRIDNRKSRGRESWNHVSRLITGTFSRSSSAQVRGSVWHRAKTTSGCQCTQASCAFQRLYHSIHDFPFPGKQLLQVKDANALERRRIELEDFLVHVQRFFSGFPRSFLETAAAMNKCDVLRLVSEFVGMDERPASLSSYADAVTTFERRPRYYSYCAGSPVSQTRLTDATNSFDEQQPSTEEVTRTGNAAVEDNQVEDEKGNHVVGVEFDPSPLTASSPSQLPDLHIKLAQVETFAPTFDSVKENLLAAMGAEAQAAIQEQQLSIEEQWELALFHAAEQGLYSEVTTALRRETNVDAVVWNELSPLHAASGGGHVHVVQCLLAHGANVNTLGPLGMTPLMYAINNSQVETTKVLLRVGADVNLANVRNVTCVHLAVVNRCLPMLLLLLDHGATVDVPNSVNKRTPLHIAAEAGDKEICELLLRYGARVSQCNSSGHDVTELAIEHGHWGVQALFNQHRRGDDSTLLEGSEEEEEKEDDEDASDSYSSVGRLYRPLLEYINDDEGEHDAGLPPHEDVAIVKNEGTVYAVL